MAALDIVSPLPMFVCSLMCLLICFGRAFLFIAQEFVDDTKVEGLFVGNEEAVV